MKILLISDTHKKLDKFYDIYERLNNIDLIIHCGDYVRDADIIEDTVGVPVISVSGNCDPYGGETHKIVETPYGNILVTHGHLENVKSSEHRLLYSAEESDCICACFGHTHQPFLEDYDGIYLINPGSLTLPRDGRNGSYAIIHSTEEDFYASIVYYDTVCGPKSGNSKSNNKKATHGGYLRKLLNYSDRF